MHIEITSIFKFNPYLVYVYLYVYGRRTDRPFEVTEAMLNHISSSWAGIAGVYQRMSGRREARRARCVGGSRHGSGRWCGRAEVPQYRRVAVWLPAAVLWS
jgi:hypothetical protein